MKANQIEVGGRYAAKVSGRLVTVRVISTVQWYTCFSGHQSTRYNCINEATGRKIIVKSAQRFRKRDDVGPKPPTWNPDGDDRMDLPAGCDEK